MIRTVNVTEKNVRPESANPVAVAAGVAVNALTDLIDDIKYNGVEILGRYIQNNTGSNLYYAFGQDCNLNNYHGILSNLQQLDCSNHGARVSVFSVAGGGTVVPTVLRRVDMYAHQNMKPSVQ